MKLRQHFLNSYVSSLTAPMGDMGDGTFFKVGGAQVYVKNNDWKFLRLELATVTSQALKYDVITYTPCEGLKCTILNKIEPLWKRIGELQYLKFK